MRPRAAAIEARVTESLLAADSVKVASDQGSADGGRSQLTGVPVPEQPAALDLTPSVHDHSARNQRLRGTKRDQIRPVRRARWRRNDQSTA